MNWLNTKYIIRTGVLTTLLLFPGLISATCKTDTIINNYKPDSLISFSVIPSGTERD